MPDKCHHPFWTRKGCPDCGVTLVQHLRTQLDETKQALAEALKQLAIADKLIAERNRIFEVCPCPEHGHCVPHVLEVLLKKFET